jgi:hypothetical protein
VSRIRPNDVPPYSENWCQSAVCENANEACYFGECLSCCNAQKFSRIALSEEEKAQDITLHLWQKRQNLSLNHKQFIKVTVTESFVSILAVRLALIFNRD